MKIAIAGYGIEGAASYRYYSAGGHDVTIVDERDQIDVPTGVATILGSGAFGQLADFDIVIRTAGLVPKKITTDGKIWSSTNEFFAQCPAPIIGVTGTKGKGTTCGLITSMLRAAGKTVHLVGNIGTPALDSLGDIQANDIVVFELSSFQLWDLEKSPHIAVVLMIEPDHLNIHEDFDDYVAAKANICKWQEQGDVCFYHPTNDFSRKIAETSKGRRVRFSRKDDGAAYVTENTFFVQDTKICDVSRLQLRGAHNYDNVNAAISVTYEFTKDIAAIAEGLTQFTSLPHRLKFVAEIAEVSYYDDSISTTPGSAIAAIRAFQQPKILILGGSDKGVDFSELITVITSENVKHVLLIGDTATQLVEMLPPERTTNLGLSVTMTEIVDRAKQVAEPNDVVILSPACASFDMFTNYAERGDQFIDAVQAMLQ